MPTTYHPLSKNPGIMEASPELGTDASPTLPSPAPDAASQPASSASAPDVVDLRGADCDDEPVSYTEILLSVLSKNLAGTWQGSQRSVTPVWGLFVPSDPTLEHAARVKSTAVTCLICHAQRYDASCVSCISCLVYLVYCRALCVYCLTQCALFSLTTVLACLQEW